MLFHALLLVGTLSVTVLGWLLFMWAQEVIDDVNEPGLYRKLNNPEDKRK